MAGAMHAHRRVRARTGADSAAFTAQACAATAFLGCGAGGGVDRGPDQPEPHRLGLEAFGHVVGQHQHQAVTIAAHQHRQRQAARAHAGADMQARPGLRVERADFTKELDAQRADYKAEARVAAGGKAY